MAVIFISYRAEDEPYGAALIDAVLASHFGPEKVFRDSRSLCPGDDYAVQLLEHLRACSTLLAVIGPRWLTAAGQPGQQHLYEDVDWMRRELVEAFRCGIRVIPILLADAFMPGAAQLPSDIARLARCQYVRLHHRTALYDVCRLIEELVALVPALGADSC